MIIDLVVGAVVIISAIISFLRGLIRETLTIAGVVGGFFAAVFFGPKLAPTFNGWLGVPENLDDPDVEVEKLFDLIPMNVVADVCAYAAVFVAVVIAISVISHFVAGAAKAMGLGPIDRTLGVIFGIARAVILLALFYMPFHLLMDEDSKAKYFASSKTHGVIEGTTEFLTRFLPSSDEVKDKVDEATESEIKKKLFENDILYNENKKKEDTGDSQQPETGYDNSERQELEKLMGTESPKFNE